LIVPRHAVRCAVYTRVSTDSGLDQEFNSLDAQYDASLSYIRSQAHAGWSLNKTRYDDGGFSGGSTDRPALQRLLDDVRSRRINIIVVYKVDRLTRSLADFAKLVELFDAYGVSFVSVTQQFNTTTSMGRLTLNVLLSFAQFEREVTSERIRDKIAASKRKGLWVGGMVPLGYELKAGKLLIVEQEAVLVRLIFARYLELRSVNKLAEELQRLGVRTKVRLLATGKTIGGILFSQGPLFYLLRNPFYVGEVRFKGEILPGPQPSLLARDLFDAVQARLTEQWSHRTVARAKSAAMLAGLLFDDAGHRMIATHSTKNKVRYWYYVSQPMIRGRCKAPVGSVDRVSAKEIEHVVLNAMMDYLRKTNGHATINHVTPRELITSHVARIEVRANQLALFLKPADVGHRSALSQCDRDAIEMDDDPSTSEPTEPTLLVPWIKPPAKAFREILLPANAARQDVRVIKTERRAALIRSITRGRAWLEEIVSGPTLSIADIAARERVSVRQVNLTISMAFLAPALVKAAIEGCLPRGIGVAALRDPPAEWSAQLERLGLDPQS
jgi:site-specific DNA recombinase